MELLRLLKKIKKTRKTKKKKKKIIIKINKNGIIKINQFKIFIILKYAQYWYK